MRICSLKNLKAKNTDLDQYFQANSVSIDPLQLYDITGKQGWFIGNPAEFNLKKKIESNGKPLKDWDINIYKGLMTGCNEAFYIDKNKKDELIKQDPKSADLIFENFRGREIKKYITDYSGDSYVIVTIDELDINKYPAIQQHLELYQNKLESRAQFIRGDHKWYSVDNCPSQKMLDSFKKSKIIYPNMTQNPVFCLDNKCSISNDKTFILTANDDDMNYILGFLNSTLCRFMLRIICPQLGDKGLELRKVFFSQLPIPILDTTDKQELARQIEVLVEQILLVKGNPNNPRSVATILNKGQTQATNLDIDSKTLGENQVKNSPLLREYPHSGGGLYHSTTELEAQIDQLVYQLYDLTADEIAVVEEN